MSCAPKSESCGQEVSDASGCERRERNATGISADLG